MEESSKVCGAIRNLLDSYKTTMSKDLTSMERTIKRPFGNGFGSLYTKYHSRICCGKSLFIMSLPTKKTHYKFVSLSQILWQKQFEGDVENDCLVTVDGTDFEIQ